MEGNKQNVIANFSALMSSMTNTLNILPSVIEDIKKDLPKKELEKLEKSLTLDEVKLKVAEAQDKLFNLRK